MINFFKNKYVIVFGLLFIVGGVFYLTRNNLYSASSRAVEIVASGNEQGKVMHDPHPLTGIKCKNADKRPFAVMLAADPVTRPLSAISKADLVVEMPVVKDKINRLMALYACNEPAEIGSIRSSRHDFIPLAAGFDAIYAHWGGSNFALDELKKGVVDNIDAMINPANSYFRKSGFLAPHNGFTSWERLARGAQFYNYRTQTNFEGYPKINKSANKDAPTTLEINYPAPHNVSYIYNPQNNSYLRFRNNSPEIDRLDNSQVEVKVLVVIKTNSRQLNADYNDVDITGNGDALIFQNGEAINATWSKADTSVNSKLKFIDEDGNETPFIAGQIWLHVVDYGTEVLFGDSRL